MQTLQLPVADQVRPARLNTAGWCMWCLKRHCMSAWCIERHERSVWAVCPECDGTECGDFATSMRCMGCVGGVVEVDAPRLSVVR